MILCSSPPKDEHARFTDPPSLDSPPKDKYASFNTPQQLTKDKHADFTTPLPLMAHLRMNVLVLPVHLKVFIFLLPT